MAHRRRPTYAPAFRAEAVKRVRKENRELRLEREIVKKATAFFAKHGE